MKTLILNIFNNRKTLLQYFIFLLVSLFAGFVFSSLKAYNEVPYGNIAGVISVIFPLMLIITLVIFAALILIRKLNLLPHLKKVFKVFDMPEQTKGDIIRRCIIGTAIFCVFYSLYVRQPCDHSKHAYWATETFDWRAIKKSVGFLTYPLWHIMVNLLYKILYVPPIAADAIVTALMHVWEFNIIYKIFVSFNKDRLLKSSNINKALSGMMALSASILFVQPIYISWFATVRWVGHGTANAWTSPTQACVYPFALIVTFLFLRMVFPDHPEEKIKFADCARFSIYLLLSVLAKPSFVQVFLPAAAVILLVRLIRTRGKSFFFSLKIAACVMPAIIWVGYIFVLVFFSNNNMNSTDSISIGFIEAWSLYTPNVFISILIGATFPITYLLLSNKKVKEKKKIFFIILCWIFGILEYMFINETGERLTHANFQWGYGVSILLMFVFVGSDYISHFINDDDRSISKIQVTVPTVILALNVFFGIEYYVELWRHNIMF